MPRAGTALRALASRLEPSAVVTLLDLFRRRPPKISGLPQPAQCDFVAIDFETANETRGSACSVGVTQVRDGHVAGEGLTLINPETHFNPYCSAVNGITE